ncbi:MAG TPA: HAMP domain-containing sensor histidine kinase [Steroidobacteraceae bacterium]|nr:HAMP domain-containing sensor histidine kinase [Steroidobacteraceae bacterium]
MRQTRILKAESFRLAALFAVLFLALTAVLIGTVLWIVAGTERDTLVSANESDIATVMNGLRAEGLGEAIEVVQQRLGTPARAAAPRHRFLPDTYMVIEDAAGRVLAGNLPYVRCEPGTFTLARPWPGGHHHPQMLLGRCAALGGALTLYVGRDTAAMYFTRQRILHAFGWVALGTCAFSILAGLFLGRRFMAQVDAVTRTCERVIAGQLNDRIPLRGRGDEWDRLARAINEMLDRISALLENLQQVSSDVAHDLRTPLTRLRNRLETARDHSTGITDYAAAIGQALEDTDRLLSMFAALLRISQIEAGTRVRSFAPVALSELLERLYQFYLPVAEDCGRPLSRELRAGISVRGDQELLMQLFSNVIENALHHTPVGTHIGLELGSAGGRIVASVRDDGPGVTDEERQKLTRRFYRGSGSRTAEGHGLGLSLVAAIAQLHGAQLLLSDAGPGLSVAVAFVPQPPPDSAGLSG